MANDKVLKETFEVISDYLHELMAEGLIEVKNYELISAQKLSTVYLMSKVSKIIDKNKKGK